MLAQAIWITCEDDQADDRERSPTDKVPVSVSRKANATRPRQQAKTDRGVAQPVDDDYSPDEDRRSS